ncbi:hypothetical protein GOP47_0027158 [Adiantum capillus-veneris]|nr:hypothetical protein GOP47_0027158 [Adiantum capillus-veneris]
MWVITNVEDAMGYLWSIQNFILKQKLDLEAAKYKAQKNAETENPSGGGLAIQRTKKYVEKLEGKIKQMRVSKLE